MKKKQTKVEKMIAREALRQKKKFDETRDIFYADGIVEDFKFPAVGDDTFEHLYEERERYSTIWREQREIEEKSILHIHQNVLAGKAGNIEVRFDKGITQSGSGEYKLANTIAMMRTGGGCEYAFFKAGDRYDAQILIEDGSENAFLVLEYKGKDTAIIRLAEFYLLGICYGEENAKETGIMVGYDGIEKNLYCDPVEEITFSPIRELLEAKWLQEKWEKAKEANEKRKESMAQQQKISKQKTA